MDLSDWLSTLTTADLRPLAEALRGGRVQPGCQGKLLRTYGMPEAWAEPLAALGGQGWTAPTLSQALAAVLTERDRAAQRKTTLVCTRPGATGPDVADTSVVVRRLFCQAGRKVLIAGFRITDREMLEPLRRPAGRELDVTLLVDLDPEIDALGRKMAPIPDQDLWPSTWWRQFLAEVWPEGMEPPKGFYAAKEGGEWRSMHAKVIVVDRRLLFVTSANFTQRGHSRNLEMGVLVEDAERAEEAVAWFEGSSRAFERLTTQGLS